MTYRSAIAGALTAPLHLLARAGMWLGFRALRAGWRGPAVLAFRAALQLELWHRAAAGDRAGVAEGRALRARAPALRRPT